MSVTPLGAISARYTTKLLHEGSSTSIHIQLSLISPRLPSESSQASPTLASCSGQSKQVSLTTSIELERSKQPSRSPALISAPFAKASAASTTLLFSGSKAKCQIRQVPSGASSKLNGGPAGSPRTFKSASVITHWKPVPSEPPSPSSVTSSCVPAPKQIV